MYRCYVHLGGIEMGKFLTILLKTLIATVYLCFHFTLMWAFIGICFFPLFYAEEYPMRAVWGPLPVAAIVFVAMVEMDSRAADGHSMGIWKGLKEILDF